MINYRNDNKINVLHIVKESRGSTYLQPADEDQDNQDNIEEDFWKISKMKSKFRFKNHSIRSPPL